MMTSTVTPRNSAKKMNNKFMSGFDSYNLCLTGDVGRTLSTSSGVLNEHIPVIVLNDMGGSVMNVSDIPCTLRSQMKHHEPIICFEPGIVKREGSDSRFVKDMCGTLRSNMGDNQPAVCIPLEHTDSVANACGCDLYNQVLTGNVACALTACMEVAGHSGPKVIIVNDKSTARIDRQTEEHTDTVYVFKERAGCPGGGKGILIAEDRAFTLATNFNGAICYETGE